MPFRPALKDGSAVPASERRRLNKRWENDSVREICSPNPVVYISTLSQQGPLLLLCHLMLPPFVPLSNLYSKNACVAQYAKPVITPVFGLLKCVMPTLASRDTCGCSTYALVASDTVRCWADSANLG